MNIALDTNAYSDFMRGEAARVQIIRSARFIYLPLIVLGGTPGRVRGWQTGIGERSKPSAVSQ